MANGEKRGQKAPGEFRASGMPGLLLVAAIGVLVALAFDFQQQGEASALFTLSQWAITLGGMLGFTDIPLWMVVVGLIAIAAGSIFYFQPLTSRGAFLLGFGLLAILLTVAPGDFAVGIQPIDSQRVDAEPALVPEASLTPGLDAVSLTPTEPSQAPTTLVQQGQSPSSINLHLTIKFAGPPDSLEKMMQKGAIRGRLHNEETNKSWNLFRSAGGSIRRHGDRLLIDAGVPVQGKSARLWVRIEVPGYAIEEQSAMATTDHSLEWTIDLNPSKTPLMVQRLGKSYWF